MIDEINNEIKYRNDAHGIPPRIEMPVMRQNESFVAVAQSSSGASGNRALRTCRSWNTKTGYMMGVLQLAAAAQDSKNRTCCALSAEY